MAQLGSAAAANTPVAANLNAASGQLHRLFADLPAFSRSAVPAIRSLGQASVVGKAAVQAAGPTVHALNQLAEPTPELAQNLAIVLHDLDDRSRAVEPDSRSPGGKGYTGLEALLQYVFNQTLAINTFGPFGHLLAVDSFVDPKCSPYATPATIALSLKQYGPSYRQCYAWLGSSQPGVNETDPSNPKACVPDPGGAPPGERGPATSACRLSAAADSASPAAAGDKGTRSATAASAGGQPGATPTAASGSSSAAAGGGSGASGSGGGSGGSGAGGSGSGSQTQQLLNYLLAP
jgi:uncharacterized membrane protein YgcG